MSFLYLLLCWPVQLVKGPLGYLAALANGPGSDLDVHNRCNRIIDQLVDRSHDSYQIEIRGR